MKRNTKLVIIGLIASSSTAGAQAQAPARLDGQGERVHADGVDKTISWGTWGFVLGLGLLILSPLIALSRLCQGKVY